MLQQISQDLAALEQHSRELQDVLDRLGISIVMVQFDASPKSPVWDQLDTGELLSGEVSRDGAGEFDSSLMSEGSWFCFYHVADLAKGLSSIKRALESRRLLNHARILALEKNEGWRVYWPATGELIVPS